MDKQLTRIIRSWFGTSLLSLTLLGSLSAYAADQPKSPQMAGPPPFAKIGDVVIEAQEFYDAVRVGIRQKFYHAAIPPEQKDAFMREVGNSLVDQVLLVQEANKRQLKPDQAFVDKKVADFELKYAKDPDWLAKREELRPLMVRQLQEQSLVKQLENAVRTIPEPEINAVKAYYGANPDKFTEPLDQKVSLILLAVDPSAGGDAWKQAQEKAADLVKQLKSGADFAETARNHSADASAQQGGKMDYAHKGMLAPEAEKALEKIQVGGITDPIVVLEGIAIFRLDGRTPPKLVSFQAAQKRASSLLMREMADQAWNALKKRLREKTPVAIHDDYYSSPPPAPGEAAKTGKQAP